MHEAKLVDNFKCLYRLHAQLLLKSWNQKFDFFFSFKTHEFVLVYFGLPEPHDRNGNIVNSTCLDTSPLQVLHFFYDEDMEKTVGILLLIRLQGFEIIEKKKKKKHVQRDRDQPESMKGSTEEIFFFFQVWNKTCVILTKYDPGNGNTKRLRTNIPNCLILRRW